MKKFNYFIQCLVVIIFYFMFCVEAESGLGLYMPEVDVNSNNEAQGLDFFSPTNWRRAIIEESYVTTTTRRPKKKKKTPKRKTKKNKHKNKKNTTRTTTNKKPQRIIKIVPLHKSSESYEKSKRAPFDIVVHIKMNESE